jgi:subtilisin family serine protease
VAVWSARAKGGGDYFTGSSYATPFITAAMAILRNKHPKEAADRIAQRLADNAIDLGKPGRDPVYGWGLLNASGMCGQDAR